MSDTSRAAWIATAARTLREAGADSPRLSAELVLRCVLGLSAVELRTYPETPVPPDALPCLKVLLQRRLAGEPVAYLIGEREFYGRSFAVNHATLIPRPETEHLIEAALAELPSSPLCFADLGTGSGCLAVTLCAERPAWKGTAADISGPALRTACANACRHGTAARLQFAAADFTRPLFRSASLDLVISNPPYVSSAEYPNLSPEVRDFEPATALLPHPQSPEGLEHLAAVARAAAVALRPGGLLLMEHGCTQGETVRLLLSSHTWCKVATYKDLAGHDRLVRAFRTETPACL